MSIVIVTASIGTGAKTIWKLCFPIPSGVSFYERQKITFLGTSYILMKFLSTWEVMGGYLKDLYNWNLHPHSHIFTEPYLQWCLFHILKLLLWFHRKLNLYHNFTSTDSPSNLFIYFNCIYIISVHIHRHFNKKLDYYTHSNEILQLSNRMLGTPVT